MLGETIFKLIVLIIFSSTFAYSQVNLKINPDIIVKTKTGGSVKITGDLIEAEAGYFKGLITSGQRINVTSFGGLSLDPGLDGTISRVTGEIYSKGNGELPNFKRYYVIDNTGGNDVTTTMKIDCIISGKFDESNNITDPYYIYGYSNEWTGYGEGSPTPPITAENVIIPTSYSDWIISDNTGIVSVEASELIPDKYELFQNYPNPFNPETIIKFALPKAADVKLDVFNLLGQHVATLLNAKKMAGYHSVSFNATRLSSGLYFYTITTNQFHEVKKMLLIK